MLFRSRSRDSSGVCIPDDLKDADAVQSDEHGALYGGHNWLLSCLRAVLYWRILSDVQGIFQRRQRWKKELLTGSPAVSDFMEHPNVRRRRI